jgi:hypothetical protein
MGKYIFLKQSVLRTFVFNQLYNAGFKVSSPKAGDFLFEEYTLEIGGKNKTTSKGKHLDNYLVVADDIEIGMGNKVPPYPPALMMTKASFLAVRGGIFEMVLECIFCLIVFIFV